MRFLVLLPVLLAGVGIGISHDLSLKHLELYERGYVEGLACGAGGGLSCGDVLSHAAAWFLGVPLAAWGLAFYLTVFGIAVGSCLFRGLEERAFLSLGALLCGLAVVVDLYLGYVMAFRVGSLCPGCLTTYALNVAMAAAFVALVRGSGGFSLGGLLPRRGELAGADEVVYYRSVLQLGLGAITLALVVTALKGVLVPLWDVRFAGQQQMQEFKALLRSGQPTVDTSVFDGQPAMGPGDAAVTVVLVGDYQCPYCRAMERSLHSLHERWPGELRSVFVNAPVSSACNPAVPSDFHQQACWLARIGECAAIEGRFAEIHASLMSVEDPEHMTRADALRGLSGVDGLDRLLACADGPGAAQALAHDVSLCKQLGIVSTPSVVIQGFLKNGGFYPEVFEEIVGFALLQAAERNRGQGLAESRVADD
ncbi:MAG: vitamin K epoxide reductase family protein [Planctomycetota bacterium]